MIRAGLPLPPSIRMRLRADAAAEGLALRIRAIRKRFVTVVRNDITAIRSVPGRLYSARVKRAQLLNTTPASSTTMMHMQDFVTRYDDLVDLLCWTAKEGVSDARRARYNELRSWFVDHYEPVRPIVTRFLDTQPEDREPVAAGTPAPRDAFESLFLPHQIDCLIHSDEVIHRIMRTRFAVEVCREQLGSVEWDCVLVG
jgi:hypothetical protein